MKLSIEIKIISALLGVELAGSGPSPRSEWDCLPNNLTGKTDQKVPKINKIKITKLVFSLRSPKETRSVPFIELCLIPGHIKSGPEILCEPPLLQWMIKIRIHPSRKSNFFFFFLRRTAAKGGGGDGRFETPLGSQN